MEKSLAAVLESAKSLPKDVQDHLIAYVEEITSQYRDGMYLLTAEERADCEAALAEMDAGIFASEEEVEAVFARYRL